MKKFLCIAFLLATAAVTTAQYGHLYYHLTGDTIERTPNNGYFEWWNWNYFIEEHKIIHYEDITGSVVNLMRFNTQTPLKILGLAGIPSSYNYMGMPLMETHRPEYFVLYEADSDSVYRVGQLQWNLADPHRHLHIESNGWNYSPDTCCAVGLWDTTVPLYEYYFDTPIIVQDSFYVGGTCNSDDFWNHDTTWTLYGWAMELFAHHGCKGDTSERPCFDRTDLHILKYKQVNTNAFRWYHYDSVGAILLIYPIVEVDTTMPPDSSGLLGMLPIPLGITNTVTLSPNPAQNSVTVTSSMNMKEIEIYNTAGILVFSDHYSGRMATIDLAGLPRGTYVVKARTTGGLVSRKLVIE